MDKLLDGFKVVNAAINIPADVAAWRLSSLGAAVTKVEPPGGDGVETECPEWFATLTEGHEFVPLDLKQEADRERLEPLLAAADVLITSNRPAALERIGLGREALAARHPELVQVAIVGHPAPDQNVPGHDLTYQASAGLLSPPDLPRTLIADMGGAERAASTAMALLLGRGRGRGERYAEVALSEAADYFAGPLRAGLTPAGGLLGGATPHYGIYRSADGWLAIASLEPHFARNVESTLGVSTSEGRDAFAAAFATRTGSEWLALAAEHDLPLAVLP